MSRRSKGLLITCPSIYTSNKMIDGGVYIENGIIQAVVDVDGLKKIKQENIEILNFSKNYRVVPGMIDLHIHGLMGVDTMDCNIDVFNKICKNLTAEGVTAFLATTITSDHLTIEKTLSLIKSYLKAKDHTGSTLLGINLEGPFISKEKAGAHNKEFVLNPDIDLFERWQHLSGENIRIVTLAPELPGAFNFIKNFREKVILSLGHTNCSYGLACKAIDEGIKLATHLFNAMSGIDHRSPGAALAVLQSNKKVTAEIIVDKFHLNEAIVNFIYKMLGRDRIVLISDAMRAKGLGPGEYEFGGKKIFVDKNTARLEDGTLAGSLLKINNAVKNMLDITKLTLTDMIPMVSENPAKLLNVYDKKGSIDVGKDADIVVIDENVNVVMTICMGEIVYIKK